MQLYPILAVLCLMLSGCVSTEPIVLDLLYGDAPTGFADGRGAKPSCRIVIATVKDERVNRETLGMALRQPIIAPRVAEWVARGLRGLGKPGRPVAAVDGGYIPIAGDLVTEVSIQRVYARTVVTQFEGVVALTGKFSRSGGSAPTERHYRGSVTKLNWANGDGEVLSVLNGALEEAISRMDEDIDEICSGETGAPRRGIKDGASPPRFE